MYARRQEKLCPSPVNCLKQRGGFFKWQLRSVGGYIMLEGVCITEISVLAP